MECQRQLQLYILLCFELTGVWDVDRNDDSNGAHFFIPHSRAVNCLTVNPSLPNHIYTTSYDGSVRRTDLEAGIVQQVIWNSGWLRVYHIYFSHFLTLTEILYVEYFINEILFSFLKTLIILNKAWHSTRLLCSCIYCHKSVYFPVTWVSICPLYMQFYFIAVQYMLYL